MPKLNDRLIRLPEVCKILGICRREAHYRMLSGEFLSPFTIHKSKHGEPTKLWSRRRVQLLADAAEGGRAEFDPDGLRPASLFNGRVSNLDALDNRRFSVDTERASIARINRSVRRGWIPMEIETALKQQELNESRARIAAEKAKWILRKEHC